MPSTTGALLLCLLGLGQAETPRVTTLTTLKEERHGIVGEKVPSRVYDRLYAGLRIEGAADVRSYGNLNVTEAKTDTGVDLIRRRKDPKAIFGVTNVPGFVAVTAYEAKARRIEEQIELFTAPRDAKTFKLKGTIEVLVGGETADIDVPNILEKQDKEALQHEAFEAAGLKIVMYRSRFGSGGNRVAYRFEGNNSIVKEVNLVDAGGKVIPVSRSGSGSRTSGQTHYLTASKKLAKDTKLRVTIYKGGKLVKLPFEFEKVELP